MEDMDIDQQDWLDSLDRDGYNYLGGLGRGAANHTFGAPLSTNSCN